jgi:hypothetical protein
MAAWPTYELADFLAFSPRTYYRLFELYNAAIWPAQAAAAVLGVAILALLRRPGTGRGRLVAAILAGCWLWVALAFHLRRYATINWAATYFAGGFVLEAVLLVWTGVVRGRLVWQPPRDPIARAGLGIFLFALVAQPLIGPLLGRQWRQAELFGVAPDPTALATLGLLLAASGARRWALAFVPAIWCAITGATLRAMAAPDAWIMPLGAALVLALAATGWWSRRRNRAYAASAGRPSRP